MTKKQPKQSKRQKVSENKGETAKDVEVVQDLDEQPNSGFGRYLRSQDGS